MKTPEEIYLKMNHNCDTPIMSKEFVLKAMEEYASQFQVKGGVSDEEIDKSLSNAGDLVEFFRNRATSLQSELEAVKKERELLKTVMVAAAEEIKEHWDKYTDAGGYGPENLLNRLEKGIASNYAGYSAGAFLELTKKNIALETELAFEKNNATDFAQKADHYRNEITEKRKEILSIQSRSEEKDQQIIYLKEILRETASRANVIMPTEEDEVVWFEEQFHGASYEFMKLLFEITGHGEAPKNIIEMLKDEDTQNKEIENAVYGMCPKCKENMTRCSCNLPSIEAILKKGYELKQKGKLKSERCVELGDLTLKEGDWLEVDGKYLNSTKEICYIFWNENYLQWSVIKFCQVNDKLDDVTDLYRQKQYNPKLANRPDWISIDRINGKLKYHTKNLLKE